MSTPVATANRGRPKDPAKRAAILDAAKQLFLSGGFSGTSMDAVAKQAGVSKLTVYSHFSDKETLFSSAVAAKCHNTLPEPLFDLDPSQPIRATLSRIGLAFIDLITSQEVIALERLMCTMATQDPEMSRLFFEAGPQRTLTAMEQLIRAANQQGLLAVPAPQSAAENFFALLQGCEHMRTMIGYREPMTATEAQPHVEQAVDMFLRAYGHS
ncbi:TetR/AcrR family transcriptional regulator [Alcanivorax sp. DP30]|uniref:TetR/AcrR family transcriptional regulator n=1 Tax=Alcanivorax sp. DP30 TaxID=2606217 RepID=UPI001370952C|nr:TetR/AcrR family transcriptional regulator [Alcanivorax sp. DP30]MZR64372.1 TetR family transcriptional regulator [Alcanivorax sp. DP30]